MLDPYAITLRDGGGTFLVTEDETFHINRKSGYTVGLAEGSAVQLKLFGTNHPVDLLPLLIRYVAATYGAQYVGTWLDGDTIVIDPVVFIDSYASATRVGRALKQQAIYDNAAKEVINL